MGQLLRRNDKEVNTENRDFKGIWIPKEIWLDKRLTPLDKIILAEINSLDSTERGCCASNDYLARFCQCSVTKVSTSISRLIDFGYLNTFSFDGRNRFIKSSLSKNESLSKFESEPFKNLKADFQKVKAINIDNNIDINIAKENIKESPENTTEKSFAKENIHIIVKYLNDKTGTRFKTTNRETQKHINARFAEGFTLDDFKTVIDKKCSAWKGTEYEQYLRPTTLFGTKFESYLNAPDVKRKTFGANGIEINPDDEEELLGF